MVGCAYRVGVVLDSAVGLVLRGGGEFVGSGGGAELAFAGGAGVQEHEGGELVGGVFFLAVDEVRTRMWMKAWATSWCRVSVAVAAVFRSRRNDAAGRSAAGGSS